MKAAQFESYGGPEVLKVVDIDRPSPNEDQVLIEVHASSINPFDDKVRKGLLQNMRKLELPVTTGGDVAGVIVELGKDARKFKVGDKVYGQASIFGGGSGAMAQFATTTQDQLALMPKNLDFAEAASLPLAGASVIQVLINSMKLSRGQSLLVQGGSGGIGSIAVQVAKGIGAYVIATVPTQAVTFVHELGADKVIDYKTQDFTTIVHDMDAVFDTVGGEIYTHSFESVKPGGIVVSMNAQPDEELARIHKARTVGQFTKTTTESLDTLRRFVEDGVVRPQVYKSFKLSQVADAFSAYEQRGVRGKIVVNIA